jgi:molybdopterin-binding protein
VTRPTISVRPECKIFSSPSPLHTAELKISIGEQQITSIITAASAREMQLKPGRPASALIKATEAQLQLTQAQISNAQAGFDYRLTLAVLRYQTTGL